LRALVVPSHDPQVVYQTCTNSISTIDLRNRLNGVTNAVVDAATEYKKLAASSQLYTVPPNHCGNNEIVLGAATKQELKDVYSSHMVPRKKPARVIYDQLLSQAPLGKCPFCGFGHASTLDHYLPKTKYPLVVVAPFNLVPSCKDCNTGKSTKIATTAERQCLHPYFDRDSFFSEQWLYAEVKQTAPAYIHFYVQPPVHWDDVSKGRVKSHFIDFNLAGRYAVEASNQIACLRDTLASYCEYIGVEGVQQHLSIEAESHARQHANSWQTAMFQALAASTWYCEGGFN
jgi:5-methylcytosine-specific restriction endonuclease McrA